MAGFQTTSTIINSDVDAAAPSGHSAATSAAALASVTAQENISLSIAASGVRGAVAATAFDALVTAVETAVETWISGTLGVNIASKDVDYIATIYSISLSSLYTNDATATYTVKVALQVRVY